MSGNRNHKPEATVSNDLSQAQMEKIRQRAYELFEARGREEGHELEDWLQAEAEVAATKTGKANA